jgi:hypothetical protein
MKPDAYGRVREEAFLQEASASLRIEVATPFATARGLLKRWAFQ